MRPRGHHVDRGLFSAAVAAPVTRAVDKLRAEGGHETAKRIVRRAYRRLDVVSLDFPLLPGDIADSSTMAPAPTAAGRAPGEPLTIGWLTTPPGAGSGGHTTMFRMIEALELAGHRCIVQVYDRHHGSLRDHAATVARSWPRVRAEVRSVDDGFRGVDGCVATSWQTAHVLATRGPADLHRLYFVQDFEPYFHPRGSTYELAADTYRFGFGIIALGHMVHDRLLKELGVASHLVPFGCDTDAYSLENTGARSGIVFYTKPDVPRRGYLLGELTLREFHRRHRDLEIHVFGDPAPDLMNVVTPHGRLTPNELNRLYNSTRAGIAMSFTNISLVAEEMLAAGTIPVVNDSIDSRADLPNQHVVWSRPTPGAMADALSRIVEGPDLAVRAATSVHGRTWHATGSAVTDIVELTCYADVRADAPGATMSAGPAR